MDVTGWVEFTDEGGARDVRVSDANLLKEEEVRVSRRNMLAEVGEF
jgi:hypothetical protein